MRFPAYLLAPFPPRLCRGRIRALAEWGRMFPEEEQVGGGIKFMNLPPLPCGPGPPQKRRRVHRRRKGGKETVWRAFCKGPVINLLGDGATVDH